MRNGFVLVAAISLALGAAGMAGAAALNWEASGSVTIADIPPFTFTGGGVATVNNSAGGVPAHLNTLRLGGSRHVFGGTQTAFITDPDTAGNAIAAIIAYVEGGTGTLAPVSGGAASTSALTKNTMPVFGMAKICLLSTACTSFLDMPFTAPTTVNGVAGTGINAMGVGGLITAGGYGGIRISLQAAPWTIKTTTVIDQITTAGGSRVFVTQVLKGWAHAPASTTSSTAQPGGVVQLVTPGEAVSNIALGSYDKLGILVSVVIRFIPEPGLFLLLGSGVVGLGLLGRSRMR